MCAQPKPQHFEAPESGSHIGNPGRLVPLGHSEDHNGGSDSGSDSLGDLIFRLNRVLARRPPLTADIDGSLGSAPPEYEGDDDRSTERS